MSNKATAASLALRVVNALARAQRVGDYDALGDPMFALCGLRDWPALFTASNCMRDFSRLCDESGHRLAASAYRDASSAFYALATRLVDEAYGRSAKEDANVRP